MIANNVIAAQNANPPHNGAVTHHHDQVITLHNFNVINTIASNPMNEIPLLDVVFLLLIIVIFKLLRRRRIELPSPVPQTGVLTIELINPYYLIMFWPLV